MVGNFATSKKSGLLRCVSRFSLAVSAATSMLASTLLFSMSVRSTEMVPVTLVKLLENLEKTWRRLNSADEWTGSIL